jgi:hypothetical protein
MNSQQHPFLPQTNFALSRAVRLGNERPTRRAARSAPVRARAAPSAAAAPAPARSEAPADGAEDHRLADAPGLRRRLRRMVELRRALVDDRVVITNRLTSALKGYSPQILGWFRDKDTLVFAASRAPPSNAKPSSNGWARLSLAPSAGVNHSRHSVHRCRWDAMGWPASPSPRCASVAPRIRAVNQESAAAERSSARRVDHESAAGCNATRGIA